MKKLLVAGIAATAFCGAPALAAELPTKAPVYKAPAAVALFNWTGPYAGVHAGWGWGSTKVSDPDNYAICTSPPGCTARWDFDGALGGVQIGYNWQTGSLLYGVEADFAFSGMKERVPNPSGFANETFSTDINWFGTLRGRLGGVSGPWLGYLTGGAAYANVENRYNDPNPGEFAVVEKVKWGWTVGAGIEYAGPSNWTWRLEYLYVDLADARAAFPVSSQFRFDFDNRFHVARVALNYRFATGKTPAPVVTRY